MKSRSENNNSTRTSYIQLDTKKCIACWECLAECENHVIGRINLPWHKHSRFVYSDDCSGCFKCINVCEPGALSKISKTSTDNNSSRKAIKQAFIVNLGLLFSGIAMSFSGFLIQFSFHMGHNSVSESVNSVSGIGYDGWAAIHKASIITFSALMLFHFFLHWEWYKTIITRKLAHKNRLQINLLIVFMLTAITGYIPWIISITGGSDFARKSFIELHDKITLLLFVLLIIHLAKRLKWYITAFDKLKNSRNA